MPTETLEKVLRENEHVQISCTACQAKFQPFDNIENDGTADAASDKRLTDSIAEAVADLAESVDTEQSPELAESASTGPVLVENVGQDADHGATENEIDVAELSDNPDSLPDWLKPPDKPANISETSDNPPEAEMAEAEARDDTSPQTDEAESEETGQSDEQEKPEEEVWETLDDLTDPAISDFSQTGTAQQTAGEGDDENAFQPLSLSQTALIGPMPVAAPEPRRGFGFFGFVKMLVFLALIAVTAGNSYLLWRQNPDVQDLFPVQMVEPAKITVREAGFEKLSSADGAPLMVSAVFVNRGAQDGVLSDFDVLLKDATGQTLMRWRVEGHGQIIPAGQQHSVSSTLFSPPSNVASVALAYPAR